MQLLGRPGLKLVESSSAEGSAEGSGDEDLLVEPQKSAELILAPLVSIANVVTDDDLFDEYPVAIGTGIEEVAEEEEEEVVAEVEVVLEVMDAICALSSTRKSKQ